MDEETNFTYSMIKSLKGISMGSLSVRSLFKNLDEIEILLKETELNVLAMQETFLNHHVGSVILESTTHNLWRADRTIASGKSCGWGSASNIH